jgi:hypothetical protein
VRDTLAATVVRYRVPIPVLGRARASATSDCAALYKCLTPNATDHREISVVRHPVPGQGMPLGASSSFRQKAAASFAPRVI